MTSIGRLADELLETIAKEDEAGDCKVLVFDLPNEQRKLKDFNIWRCKNDY